MQWTLQDLIALRDAGVAIDRETFDSVLAYENCNRNLSECQLCKTPSMGQHASFCDRASILWDIEWYEIIRQRELESEVTNEG
jgi:hypothetical protein